MQAQERPFSELHELIMSEVWARAARDIMRDWGFVYTISGLFAGYAALFKGEFLPWVTGLAVFGFCSLLASEIYCRRALERINVQRVKLRLKGSA